jgi:hypothetical protein
VVWNRIVCCCQSRELLGGLQQQQQDHSHPSGRLPAGSEAVCVEGMAAAPARA